MSRSFAKFETDRGPLREFLLAFPAREVRRRDMSLHRLQLSAAAKVFLDLPRPLTILFGTQSRLQFIGCHVPSCLRADPAILCILGRIGTPEKLNARKHLNEKAGCSLVPRPCYCGSTLLFRCSLWTKWRSKLAGAGWRAQPPSPEPAGSAGPARRLSRFDGDGAIQPEPLRCSHAQLPPEPA